MFDWLTRPDWRNSPAHLLLLSKFRKGDSPTRYRSDSGYWAVQGWAAVLREDPTKAIQRFIKDGMLEPAGLREGVEHRFKTSDLRLLLKDRGLKVSGCKEDLINRLIESDAKAIYEATKGLDLYRCTVAGMELAENYLEGERVKRETSECEVFRLVTRGEFWEAVRLVARYEAAQVFPRGLNVDWRNYDGTGDVVALKAIFSGCPAILQGIEEDRLRQLRPVAAMMLLWDTKAPRHWLPEGFETGIHLDGPAACRMLEFYGYHERHMKEYKDLGVKMVEVATTNDGLTCPECRKINRKKYRLANMLELPYAKCTCEGGCRCTAQPYLS